jgi:hypothetical protein
MDKIILDAAVRAKLNGLERELEVCDETGHTLGHFLPPAVYQKLLYAWLNAQVTDEELERASQEPGGRTLEEIWRELGQA